jgi:molybdenum cofactor cytidylyltransferase
MISALILAAGQSKRMGQPKMCLPWGEKTVLEQVIDTFKAVSVDQILVITGGDREQVEMLVGELAQVVFNPEFAKGEMLSSVQVGLARIKPKTKAVLVALGDQPQVQKRCVQLVMDAYHESGASIIVPSFKMRRGHPWLVAHPHWDEILRMDSPDSLRGFLHRHADEICYVTVDSDSILQDLDTPEDYLKFKP